MIASLRGRLRRRLDDRIVVESGGIGYEVVLPPVVRDGLGEPWSRTATTRPSSVSSSITTRRATSRARC